MRRTSARPQHAECRVIHVCMYTFGASNQGLPWVLTGSPPIHTHALSRSRNYCTPSASLTRRYLCAYREKGSIRHPAFSHPSQGATRGARGPTTPRRSPRRPLAHWQSEVSGTADGSRRATSASMCVTFAHTRTQMRARLAQNARQAAGSSSSVRTAAHIAAHRVAEQSEE